MSSKRMNRKLRNRLAGRVLAGKITPAQAWDALNAAGVRNHRNVRAPAAKSVPAPRAAVKSAGPDLLKGYTPPGLGDPGRPAEQWSGTQLARLQQYREHSSPALREGAFQSLVHEREAV